VDLILIKSRDVKARDCKVIPGEACLTQHRLVSADLKVNNLKVTKKRKTTRE